LKCFIPQRLCHRTNKLLKRFYNFNKTYKIHKTFNKMRTYQHLILIQLVPHRHESVSEYKFSLKSFLLRKLVLYIKKIHLIMKKNIMRIILFNKEETIIKNNNNNSKIRKSKNLIIIIIIIIIDFWRWISLLYINTKDHLKICNLTINIILIAVIYLHCNSKPNNHNKKNNNNCIKIRIML